jgi:hypothetical protein
VFAKILQHVLKQYGPPASQPTARSIGNPPAMRPSA